MILATGGEPKVPQLKDATKAMSLEVTFQKDSGHSGGMGEGKHPGVFFGKKHMGFGKNESYSYRLLKL